MNWIDETIKAIRPTQIHWIVHALAVVSAAAGGIVLAVVGS